MIDMVNHPPHYEQQAIRLEPIDVLRFAPFDLGNALKYIIRARHKGNELQDLKKAEFYLKCVQESVTISDEYKTYVNDFSRRYGHLVRRFEGCFEFACDGGRALLGRVRIRIAEIENCER